MGNLLPGVDQPKDFFGLGKTIFCFLGKYQIPINFHFKNSSAGCDEFTLQTTMIFDGGRQTGGRWLVISNLAVFNTDAHGLS